MSEITLLSIKVLLGFLVMIKSLLTNTLEFEDLSDFLIKFKNFKWKGNELRYLFLITCGILIPTILVWSIPIIILLYIILSFVENSDKGIIRGII